jgi:hypothetical protein
LLDRSDSPEVASEVIFAWSSCCFCWLSRRVSFACSVSMRETVSPLFKSSVARCTLNFERINSVAFCSWVIRPCAVAC